MVFAALVRSYTAQVPYSFVKEQSQHSTASPKKLSISILLKEDGGGERTRTDDLLRARQALSQLSYTPKKTILGCPIRRLIARSSHQTAKASYAQPPTDVTWWA
jgi:hypothetical protein